MRLIAEVGRRRSTMRSTSVSVAGGAMPSHEPICRWAAVMHSLYYIMPELAWQSVADSTDLVPSPTHRHPVQLYSRHSDSDRDALPVFAASADAFVERQ